MLSAILLAFAIVVIGQGLPDRVRLTQERVILEKLPVAEAAAYYELLRRRVMRVRALRLVFVLSLLTVLWVYRNRLR